ncbi:hypothetical protein [Ketobacter alkanivorans]|uniref:Uncharacterized protein n=1 Tax=Ketobacter alkanivorans TaxID=1917421 RepID=A0A2K9LHA8_9GAMM|nr:hypothetical protein [Ketobacter alkanivorans]AUM11672.1 hypothetical protein Kalk_04220 [Ketobacter alkanivorans]MCP5015248.1 hypothetical protein [Ketobacter sp.]
MIDYELTDLLIELEEIQQDRFLNKARGQQVVDLLAFYDIPESLYELRQEPQNGREPHQCRRKIALFNFAHVPPEFKVQLIECLFMIGHSPEFIAEAMGEDIRAVAESLRSVVDENRARRASDLRKNPQRFRLVKS